MSENSIKEIIIKEKANQEVPGLIKKLSTFRKVYLIADENTYSVAGNDLKEILKKDGFQVELLILEGEKIIANTEYLFKVLKGVKRDGYLIACGAGTINDLTRYISYKLEVPYMIVATAPSMDGYASHVSPITEEGVKTTYNAVTAEAIVADIDILKEAPWEMIQAGYGDLIGKISALMDWKLSNILFDIKLNPEAISLVENELIRLIDLTPQLKERTTESIKVLTKGLINSGIAMQIEGNSRPASGTEHHISHFLEMYGEIYERNLPTHGVKVALGEYFASSLYLKLYEVDFKELSNCDDKEKRRKRIKENYLARANPVLKVLDERWEEYQLDIDKLIEKEKEIKELIEENIEYLKGIKNYLAQLGIFDREDIKSIDKKSLLKALQSAFEIRNRYTVASLLDQVGLLEEFSQQLLDDYLRIIEDNTPRA
ncbi:sn-glycerol-1-phosphate dehydrogenase [Natronospora cellulosivora (SeqCode)]